MTSQKLKLVTRELLDLFHMFDYWLPSRLCEETGIKLERIKYLASMRKSFNSKRSDDELGLSKEQMIIAENFSKALSMIEANALKKLLPSNEIGNRFDFIDLFAGIGGIRKPFEEIGGRCVLTCEWDEYAKKTYKSNFKNCEEHIFVDDIKSITQPKGHRGKKQAEHIEGIVPQHTVLLAGFPCQPFSIAGVSKKNSLNRAHGFACEDQGQLFFDICRILSVKQPPVVILENVKNLKSHDKGNTFRVITEMITNLKESQSTLFGENLNRDIQSYWIANLNDEKPDPKIINAKAFLPQNRERIVMICIRQDIVDSLSLDKLIDMRNITKPTLPLTLKDVLDKNEIVDEKYTLSLKLWEYLKSYASKHKENGNGFGYGMVFRNRKDSTARTLSARYYKDGSEILVNQDDIGRVPRRLTPQECARLMGFSSKFEKFSIPVSDTRAYKQFGNSVAVPVFRAVASFLSDYIDVIKKADHKPCKSKVS